jgi:hypothetical protein
MRTYLLQVLGFGLFLLSILGKPQPDQHPLMVHFTLFIGVVAFGLGLIAEKIEKK